uniref:CDP-alcohol phosphatidyltransferase family protein n=1 Tax=Jeotgalibaca porci TaxID=1868793 RepID=UPI00359F6646
MKHVPNLLTLLRLFMIPIYLLVFYMESPNALQYALFIFIGASFTEVLDGYLARKYEVVSKFGIVADPF